MVFADLRDAVRSHPDLVRRYIGQREVNAPHAHFWALAHAAWTGGTFLYVPDGVIVDRPLVATAHLPEGEVAWYPLSLVVAGTDSSVTLLNASAHQTEAAAGTAASPTWWPSGEPGCATRTSSSSATRPGTSASSAWRSARTPT